MLISRMDTVCFVKAFFQLVNIRSTQKPSSPPAALPGRLVAAGLCERVIITHENMEADRCEGSYKNCNNQKNLKK